MKLKTKNKSEIYDPSVCAASRCVESPVLFVEGVVHQGEVISSKSPTIRALGITERVPFCNRHWAERCAAAKTEAEGALS